VQQERTNQSKNRQDRVANQKDDTGHTTGTQVPVHQRRRWTRLNLT
jgi:hypothetical protein